MTPLEALELLDKLAGLTRTSRQGHEKINEARNVLWDFIARHGGDECSSAEDIDPNYANAQRV